MQDAEHTRIRVLLKQRLDAATAQYRVRSANFSEIMKDVPSGIPQPDGTLRITGAGREYRFALERYMLALAQYSDFILRGTLPE